MNGYARPFELYLAFERVILFKQPGDAHDGAKEPTFWFGIRYVIDVTV